MYYFLLPASDTEGKKEPGETLLPRFENTSSGSPVPRLAPGGYGAPCRGLFFHARYLSPLPN